MVLDFLGSTPPKLHSTKMYLARITEIEGSGGGHVCDPHNEIYHLCFFGQKKRKVKNVITSKFAPPLKPLIKFISVPFFYIERKNGF